MLVRVIAVVAIAVLMWGVESLDPMPLLVWCVPALLLVNALRAPSIIAARGLTFRSAVTSLYYRDPDGNLVELQVDNFATPDEATAYMRGPEYGADAVGVGFLPEAMQAALAAGTPKAVLQTRKWALESSPGLPNPIIELTR